MRLKHSSLIVFVQITTKISKVATLPFWDRFRTAIPSKKPTTYLECLTERHVTAVFSLLPHANQHTELMTEMEESFANNHPDSENNHDNALELRRWQQWRDTTEPAGLDTTTRGTGCAARPIEIDGEAADPTTTAPNGRERQGGGAPLEETETLWGHAVHEHELSPGDQVRPACLFARCLVTPTTNPLMFVSSRI